MAKGGLPVTLVDTSGQYVPAVPEALVTGGGVNGIKPRLRVDVGQTGFFAGREFRTFKELNIALGATYVIKAVVPLNIILFSLDVTLISGEVKVSSVFGGTEGGVFSETLPVFARNTMSEVPQPPYTPVVTLTAGGTHTGGTVLDLLWVKTADNAQFAASVGNAEGDERGIGANTFYLRLNAIVAATGVFKARWEERP